MSRHAAFVLTLMVPVFLASGCFMQDEEASSSGSDTESDTEGSAGATSVTTAGTGGECSELDCDTEGGVEDESTGGSSESTGGWLVWLELPPPQAASPATEIVVMIRADVSFMTVSRYQVPKTRCGGNADRYNGLERILGPCLSP